MDKKEFSIGMDIILQSLRDCLVKTDEREFAYFILNFPKIMEYVAQSKNIQIVTECNYRIKSDGKSDGAKKKIKMV